MSNVVGLAVVGGKHDHTIMRHGCRSTDGDHLGRCGRHGTMVSRRRVGGRVGSNQGGFANGLTSDGGDELSIFLTGT